MFVRFGGGPGLQCIYNDFSRFFVGDAFPCALPWQTGPLVDKVFAWIHEMSSQGFEAASTFVIQLLHISLWYPCSPKRVS